MSPIARRTSQLYQSESDASLTVRAEAPVCAPYRAQSFVMITAWLCLVSACGGGSPTAPTPATSTPSPATTVVTSAPAATVSSVVLTVSGSQVSSITLSVNQSTTISASVRDRSGNTMSGKTVQWFTSDTSVVNGAPSGNTVTITGYKVGSATVTATVDGVSSAVPVDVRATTSAPAPTSYYV